MCSEKRGTNDLPQMAIEDGIADTDLTLLSDISDSAARTEAISLTAFLLSSISRLPQTYDLGFLYSIYCAPTYCRS